MTVQPANNTQLHTLAKERQENNRVPSAASKTPSWVIIRAETRDERVPRVKLLLHFHVALSKSKANSTA